MTPISPKEKGNLWLGFSSVFFLLAAVSYFSPSSSPAIGRWAWLHNAFSSLFGVWSEVVLFAVFGSICVLVAMFNFRAAHNGNA
jgi:hypothetical protein